MSAHPHALVLYSVVLPLGDRGIESGTLDIAVEDHGYFLAFALRTGAPVEVLASGASTASCERARQPSGAPGPLRCDYRGPGPPEP